MFGFNLQRSMFNVMSCQLERHDLNCGRNTADRLDGAGCLAYRKSSGREIPKISIAGGLFYLPSIER